MKVLRIEPKQEGKGRTFVADLVGYATANALWDKGEYARPIWLSYITSEGQTRPFTANLRLGRKVLVGEKSFSRGTGEYLELLKSVGYEFSLQRFPEGTLTTVYLPSLFRMDPGMVDPDYIRFVLLPSVEWLETQEIDLPAMLRHLGRLSYICFDSNSKGYPTQEEASHLALLASLFASFMDRRTRCPILQDPRFHLQLLVRCLRSKAASLSVPDNRSRYSDDFGCHSEFGFTEHTTSLAGLVPGIAVNTTHDVLEQMMSEEVSKFFAVADRV